MQASSISASSSSSSTTASSTTSSSTTSSSSLPYWALVYQNEIQQTLFLYIYKDIVPLIHLYYFDYGNLSPLAPFQQIAFEACCTNRENVFITGPAGTGKTFLLQSIVTRLQKLKRNVIVTASTGVAAIMIHGQTLHSFAKLNRIQQPDLNDPHEREYWMDIWEHVDVLVIDEISMITPNDFATLVQLWKGLNILSQLQVIILGYFFQLPAVIKNEAKLSSPRESPAFAYCFQTPEWSEIITKTVYLHDVFRQADQEFVRTLNLIRVGNFTSFDLESLCERWVGHPNYANSRPIHLHKDEYTWIFATNQEADQHNHGIIRQIRGETHMYTARFGFAGLKQRGMGDNGKNNTFQASTDVSIKKELFNVYTSGEHVPSQKQFYFTDPKYRNMFHVKQELRLKVGVRVLLTVNLRTEHGLVNGARGTIVDFAPNKLPMANSMILPIVKFDAGPIVHILLHEWQLVLDRTVRNKARSFLYMVQLPLRYAYATTTHQSQGQSLSNVVISLRRAFTYGQGYVALSRARTLQDLHLLDSLHSKMFRVDPIVQRFYRELNM